MYDTSPVPHQNERRSNARCCSPHPSRSGAGVNAPRRLAERGALAFVVAFAWCGSPRSAEAQFRDPYGHGRFDHLESESSPEGMSRLDPLMQTLQVLRGLNQMAELSRRLRPPAPPQYPLRGVAPRSPSRIPQRPIPTYRPTPVPRPRPAPVQRRQPEPIPAPIPDQTVPINRIPPAETKRLALTSLPNTLPQTTMAKLPPSRIDPISGELALYLRQQYEDFAAAFEESLDRQLDLAFAKGLGLPPSVAEAMKKGQYETAKEIIAAAGLNPSKVVQATQFVDRFKRRKQLSEKLRQGLQAGQSLTQLQPTLDAIQDALSTPSGNAGIQSLQQSALVGVAGISTTLLIEELLLGGPPASPDPWNLFGGDPVLVIFDPTLAPEEYFHAGSNLVVCCSHDGSFSTGFMPLGQALPIPIGVSSPAPDAPPAETVASDYRVLLRNPAENERPISFRILRRDRSSAGDFMVESDDEISVTLGSRHDKRIIEFRSANEGVKQFTVGHGAYHFRVESSRWNLHASGTFPVKIRNEHGIAEFHFVSDNERHVVPPGESLDLESNFPVVVEFDRGDGIEKARRRLEKGDYTVAIDRESSTWDLFADVQLPGEPPPDHLGQRDNQGPGDEERPKRPRW